MMNAVLTALYGAGGLVATALYLPTIAKLVRDAECWKGQSLVSWSGWIMVATVSLLYAVLVNGDPVFMFATSLNFAAQTVVLTIILVQRARSRRGAEPLLASNDDEAIALPQAA